MFKQWFLSKSHQVDEQISKKGIKRHQHTNTQTKAATLIEEAHVQAAKIIRDTNFFSRQVQLNIKKNLKSIADKVAQDSQQQLREITDTHNQSVQALLTRIEKVTNDEILSLTKQAKIHLEKFEHRLDDMAEQEYNELKKIRKIDQQRRIKKFITKLDDQLPNIVKDVVGHAIPLKEHKELIKEAIKRAHREGVWND